MALVKRNAALRECFGAPLPHEGAFGYSEAMFKVVPHEETAWGTLFAIVDPKGRIVGLDRYTPAVERASALERQRGAIKLVKG